MILLKDLIPCMSSYYEVVDLKNNLIYSRGYYIADYDYCKVHNMCIDELFDGSPYIKITIERGCYGA